eukprot:1168972-Amphidinium_carterae.1
MRRHWRDQTSKKYGRKLEACLEFIMRTCLSFCLEYRAANAIVLVVNTSERNEGKIKFKEVQEIQSGSTPRAIIAEMEMLWREAGDEEEQWADFTEKMLR